MRISDWSSDVCSSDLERKDGHVLAGRRLGLLPRRSGAKPAAPGENHVDRQQKEQDAAGDAEGGKRDAECAQQRLAEKGEAEQHGRRDAHAAECGTPPLARRLVRSDADERSEEHTSELQSLMRIT